MKKRLFAIMQLPEDSARKMLEQIRWPNGAACVHCGSTKVKLLQGESTRPGLYKCGEKECRKQFTVTVNTPMDRSRIPLNKWVIAIYMLCTERKGVSALQLMKRLELGSYETAWHMAHRLRCMMQTKEFASKLSGTVEVDETYVGGKPRPKAGEPRPKRGRGTNKTPVFVMVQRGGEVRAKVVKNSTRHKLVPIIHENIEKTATIYSDEWCAYRGLDQDFAAHKIVNHSRKQYVNGDAHTNTAESFNCLIKRGHKGVYHYMSKKHLHRYIDEYTFRWNNRAEDTTVVGECFRGGEGKRLMYKDLVA